jgi:hypothetical protein
VCAANGGLREAPWGVYRGGRGSTLATHVVMSERRVYGHSCRRRCGDRRKASHEYEVRTLLIIHFMATKVAWDARPEKKVKFSALFAQFLHINCIQQLKGLIH